MKVAKWGNSLAVRIPAAKVEELGLKAGDEVDISLYRPSAAALRIRNMTRKQALKELRKFAGMLPADFKFNREEANKR